MDNSGLLLPSYMPNVCVWNPLVMSSKFGVLVCPWTGQTQREINHQSLRNKYIINYYTRVQCLCFSNYILCTISLWKPDMVEYCYGSFLNRENWSMEGFSHGALLVQNSSFSSLWNSFSRKHKIYLSPNLKLLLYRHTHALWSVKPHLNFEVWRHLLALNCMVLAINIC